MNGEILTLNKTINRFHQADIERLNNIAKELISDKYKESAKNE